MIHGSCACGRVRYQSCATPSRATACHCKTCQRISGGPCICFVDVPSATLEWTTAPDIFSNSAIAERGHCSVCGSSMSMAYFAAPEEVAIVMATITAADLPLPRPDLHIFCAEMVSWFVIPDNGGEAYDWFNPAFQRLIDRWRARILLGGSVTE